MEKIKANKDKDTRRKVPQRNAKVVQPGSAGGGKRKNIDDTSLEKPKKLIKREAASASPGTGPSAKRYQLESRHFEAKIPKHEDSDKARDLLKHEPKDQNMHKLMKPKKNLHEVKLGQLKRTNSDSGEMKSTNPRSSISMHSLDVISHSEELLIKEKKSLETLIDLRNEEIQDLLAKIQEEQSKQKEILSQVSKFQI